MLQTYLKKSDAEAVIQETGKLLREFLQFLSDPESSPLFSGKLDLKAEIGEWQQIYAEEIEAFQSNPENFSVQSLVEKGSDFREAMHHMFRMEVRDIKPDGSVAHIAVKGILGEFRKIAIDHLLAQESLKSANLTLRSSGHTSIECSAKGVNKGLTINYFRRRFDSFLNAIGYESGTVIDARQSRMLMSADGDGTLYSKPRKGYAPPLRESMAYESLKTYLSLGGVFVVISGNQMLRTIDRVQEDLSVDIRSNMVLVANGGASMVGFDKKGNAFDVDDYHEHAFDAGDEEDLDLIFIGDDHKPHGNDRPGFEAAGFDRSILVTDHEPIAPLDQIKVVPGFEKGTAEILKKVNQMAGIKPKSFFENFEL